MKQSGIYKIESISHPERVYIGSAVWIEQRWKDHRNKLNRGVHENSKLQNHYNKYYKGDLIYTILAICSIEDIRPINNVVWLEQFFILVYKPYFNIARIAGSNLGIKYSAEVCKRQSERLKGVNTWSKGRALTPEHIAKVSKALMGNQYAKGFKHTEETKLKESIAQKSRTDNREMPKLKKPVLQYDLNMNFIQAWDSASNAAKVLGLYSAGICRCCLGEYSTSKGFIWKYKNIQDEKTA